MLEATRFSWKILPIPTLRAQIHLRLKFSILEGERIIRGYVPEDMSDKWFIFFENDWLFFHRSWTGICIYGVRLDFSSDGVLVTDAWVNEDKEQYRSPGTAYDARMIAELISGRLLT